MLKTVWASTRQSDFKTLRLYSRSLFLILLTTVSLSCQKERIQEYDHNGKKSITSALFREDGAKWNTCLDGVDLVCGNMLTFTDVNHFLSVYSCLESAYENWNDSIEDVYAHLNDEDYNDLWEQNGWDEDYPFIQFENYFNHSSLRATIATMEEDWMNDPDNMPDPDDFDIFQDEAMNALWSSNYNIKIGNDLIHIFPNGRYLIVDNADCNLFFSMISDSSQTNPNARMGGPTIINPAVSNDACWRYGFERNFRVPSNPQNYFRYDYNDEIYATKFKTRVATINIGIVEWHTMKAKIRSYKSRNNGNGFKKHRTLIQISVAGNLYRASNCSLIISANLAGDAPAIKRRWKYKAKRREIEPNYEYAIKEDEVTAAISFSATQYTEQLIIKQ